MPIQWLKENLLENVESFIDQDDEPILESTPNHGTEYLNDYNTVTFWSSKSKSDVRILANLGTLVTIDTCIVLGTLKKSENLVLRYGTTDDVPFSRVLPKPFDGTSFGTLLNIGTYQYWRLDIETDNVPALRRGQINAANYGQPKENRLGLNDGDSLVWYLGDNLTDYIREGFNSYQGAIRFRFVPKWSGTTFGTKTILSMGTYSFSSDNFNEYLLLKKIGEKIQLKLNPGSGWLKTEVSGTKIVPYGTYHLVFTWSYQNEVVPGYYMALYLDANVGTINEGTKKNNLRLGNIRYLILSHNSIEPNDLGIESLLITDYHWGSSKVENDYLNKPRTLMKTSTCLFAPFISKNSDIRLTNDPDYNRGWVESDIFYWKKSQEETNFVTRVNDVTYPNKGNWDFDQNPSTIGTAEIQLSKDTLKYFRSVTGSCFIPTSEGTLDASISYIDTIESGYHFGYILVHTSENPYNMKYTFNIFGTSGTSSLFGTDLLEGTWNEIDYHIKIDEQQQLRWTFGIWGTVNYTGTGTFLFKVSEINLYKGVTETGTTRWYSSAGTTNLSGIYGTFKWFFYKAGTTDIYDESGTVPVSHYCLEVGTRGPSLFNWKTKSEKHIIHEWYLGRKIELSENPEAIYNIKDHFDTDTYTSRGGKHFSYYKWQSRTWQFTYSCMSDEDRNALREIIRKCKGPYKPLYFVLYPENPEVVRARLTQDHEWQDVIGGFNYTLILEESK